MANEDSEDEADNVEEDLDLSRKKPKQVKSDVESLVKEFGGDLRTCQSQANLEHERLAIASETLVKYARFTWENSGEKVSRKVYAGLLYGGLPAIMRLLWDVKSDQKIDLDDDLRHHIFAKVKLILLLICIVM